MKHLLMTVIATAALATTAIVSCTSHQPKSLILLYSQTGATEAVAKELQKQTGANIEKFDVAEVYDGDYMATIERVKGERETGYIPTLKPLTSNLSKYDIIYLAYPIWFGTCAPPVKALLQTVGAEGKDSFKGKTIVPICTFGSGGLESSTEYLLQALPQSIIAKGFGIRNARIQEAAEELNRFLIENGYKEGSVEALPEYSGFRTEISPEELSAYNEATAGYPYPMGEPVSVARRRVADGYDYIFGVIGKGPDGVAREGKVFVCTRTGKAAEFTKAIR